jgi:hypothetical protein
VLQVSEAARRTMMVERPVKQCILRISTQQPFHMRDSNINGIAHLWRCAWALHRNPGACCWNRATYYAAILVFSVQQVVLGAYMSRS